MISSRKSSSTHKENVSPVAEVKTQVLYANGSISGRESLKKLLATNAELKAKRESMPGLFDGEFHMSMLLNS